MSDESALPFLSRFDPPETAEGSLDPLGFYVLADGLAVRLAPGVRERQVNPRFLTIALAGMAARAAGGIAEASPKGLPSWLVYEWVIVEALVSQALDERDRNLAQGIPGRDKVQSTLLAGDALALGNYLKTPSVFGFHGVYRVLGLKTGLFHAAGQPSDAGFALLQAWELDQGLSGFVSGTGPGTEFRQALVRAVSAGLESECSRLRNRQLIGWIRQHLAHRQVGPEEGVALWEALKGDALRSEYLDLLTSAEGQAQWLAADGDQALIHRWMSRRASDSLRLLLHAVQSIERFFRLLNDGFDEVRDTLGEARCALPIAKVCTGPAVARAAEDAPRAYRDAMEALGQVEPSLRARGELTFSWAGAPMSAASFAGSLIAHHERIQRTKPPNGKRSWFDTFSDGRIALRAAYVLQEPFSPNPDRYVHPYRIGPLWSFSSRLRRVSLQQDTQEIA